MVPDVATGDRMAMLCLNCARRVVSPRSVSKYAGLTGHLRFRSAFTDQVRLTFAKIDGLIGSNLPMEAYRSENWWNNAPGTARAKVWLEAGWEVQEVNLREGYVVFKKNRKLPIKKTRRKRAKESITKPFTPVPVHPYGPKVPSKTKVSRLYARIKNIERQRNPSLRLNHSFIPKPQREKKMFWSDERPK